MAKWGAEALAYNRYINQNGSLKRVPVPDLAAPPKIPDNRAQPGFKPGPVKHPPGLDLDGIGRMLRRILPQDLDTGDILLFAVLLLLYVDSGDIEMLLVLGLLFFMK